MLTLACWALLTLSSCFVHKGPVTSFNGPAFYNNDVSYQPKPIAADSIHHATYLSASIIKGQGANSNDMVNAGQLNLSMAFTTKHYNFSLGAFGGLGDFENKTVPDTQAYFFRNKSTGLGGGRASFNYYITSGKVDIRIIGIEATYSHEFGQYADFRKQVVGQPFYYTITSTDLFTYGASSEVAWYGPDPSFQYALRLFVGQTNPGFTSFNPETFQFQTQKLATSLAYFMQIKNVFMIVDVNPNGGHFSLGYRFQ